MKTTQIKYFHHFQPAFDLRHYLAEKGLTVDVREQRELLDFYDLGPRLNLYYTLHISVEDFELYKSLIAVYANEYIAEHKLEGHPEYYINSLSKNELLETIYQYDNTNEIDYILAKRKLNALGVDLTDGTLETIQEIRKQSKIQDYSSMKPFVLAGYFFALFGGVLGIAIGYFLWKGKTQVPYEEQFHIHDAQTHKHGKYIFILSLIMSPFSIFFNLLTML